MRGGKSQLKQFNAALSKAHPVSILTVMEKEGPNILMHISVLKRANVIAAKFFAEDSSVPACDVSAQPQSTMAS